jgi:hypothetical protein
VSLQSRISALITAVGADIKKLQIPPLVTVLPTTGPNGGALVDGQECRFSVDASTVWNLKYNATSGKWNYIGGPPMYQEVTTAESTATLNAFTALATAGPSMALPLAGDYMIEIGFAGSAAAAGVAVRMGYNMAPIAASLNDVVMFESKVATAYIETVSRVRVKTGIAVGTSLNARYQTSHASAIWSNRWMKVTPIRVS